MPEARLAVSSDLRSLLELYLHLNPNMPELESQKAESIWSDILSHKGSFVFVSDVGSAEETKLVASCMLITAPNLMRNGQGHAIIENVVTHADYRRQGHGKAVIEAALNKAWELDCYHALLQSGRKDPGVEAFYESCGFIPGIRIGYVAQRPNN